MIGTAITKMNKLVDIIFLSLSGGMMLYVGCNNIVINEFHEKATHVPLKLLTMVGGVACVGLMVQYLVLHDHSEHDGGHGGGHGGHHPH